eukprot:7177051-Karenia_brevis.AAC.1
MHFLPESMNQLYHPIFQGSELMNTFDQRVWAGLPSSVIARTIDDKAGDLAAQSVISYSMK